MQEVGWASGCRVSGRPGRSGLGGPGPAIAGTTRRRAAKRLDHFLAPWSEQVLALAARWDGDEKNDANRESGAHEHAQDDGGHVSRVTDDAENGESTHRQVRRHTTVRLGFRDRHPRLSTRSAP